MDIGEIIAGRGSVRGALFGLRQHLQAVNGCDLGYEFVVRRRAYVRGDLVQVTTLSVDYQDLYLNAGGTNSDPVIDQVGLGQNCMVIILDEVLEDSGSRYFRNSFFQRLRENGCTSLAAYFVDPASPVGYAVMTVFENEEQSKMRQNGLDLSDTALDLHVNLRKHGQLARFFDVSLAEATVLEAVATGRTADDIADSLNLTRRAVELRLQKVRLKLHARSSAEAVYKAVAYGILPVAG